VHAKDVERVRALLETGHGPDVVEPWGDSLLHYLVHEFQVTRSTQGPRVLEIIELLLKYGANPEQVGANNWRAVDLSIEAGLKELTEVFVRYGAKDAQREFT
jgi:hypothetical protein